MTYASLITRSSKLSLVAAVALSMGLIGCAGQGAGGVGAEQDGAQIGEAGGQLAGQAAAKEVPFGGLVGGILGRHAGQAAGAGIDHAATGQPAQQTTPAPTK